MYAVVNPDVFVGLNKAVGANLHVYMLMMMMMTIGNNNNDDCISPRLVPLHAQPSFFYFYSYLITLPTNFKNKVLDTRFLILFI
jgi:hypothetical protein